VVILRPRVLGEPSADFAGVFALDEVGSVLARADRASTMISPSSTSRSIKAAWSSSRPARGFREQLGGPRRDYDPETLPALAAQYGGEIDFDRTMPLVERHGLVF
jgi:hypothetical protein